MVEGKCNCGLVIFEYSTLPSEIYMCHCSICRRFSGSTGAAIAIIKNVEFRWLSGQDMVKVWRAPDADWEANFCSNCGSSLPGKNDAQHMFIPAGLLPSDIESVEVSHHIFVDSKASWDVIGDDGKQHPGSFES